MRADLFPHIYTISSCYEYFYTFLAFFYAFLAGNKGGGSILTFAGREGDIIKLNIFNGFSYDNPQIGQRCPAPMANLRRMCLLVRADFDNTWERSVVTPLL